MIRSTHVLTHIILYIDVFHNHILFPYNIIIKDMNISLLQPETADEKMTCIVYSHSDSLASNWRQMYGGTGE